MCKLCQNNINFVYQSLKNTVDFHWGVVFVICLMNFSSLLVPKLKCLGSDKEELIGAAPQCFRQANVIVFVANSKVIVEVLHSLFFKALI